MMVGLFFFNEMHTMLMPSRGGAPEEPSPPPSEDCSDVDLLRGGGVTVSSQRSAVHFLQPGLGHLLFATQVKHVAAPTLQPRTHHDIRERYLTHVTGTPSPRHSGLGSTQDSPPPQLSRARGGQEITFSAAPGYMYSTSVGTDGRPKSPSRYFIPNK